MDQIKIGAFISECRKNAGLTQMQLAEKLNISDRAISKWERGKSLPDSSIMLQLCSILKITVNDLLSGEVVQMENYNKELESNLLEMIKQKEKADKQLLMIEIVMVIICLIPLLTSVFLTLFLPLEEWIEAVIVLVCLVPILIAAPFAIRIEQTAGYYVCKTCANSYKPQYISVFGAMHIGRTRYMRCPRCKKFSWHKKVLRKKDKE